MLKSPLHLLLLAAFGLWPSAQAAVIADPAQADALAVEQITPVIVGPNSVPTPPNPPAQGGNYPGVASLIIGSTTGSGALIAPTVVLTAAHVAEVYTGSGTVNFFGASRSITSVSIHPLWTSVPGGNLNYDIALVTLNSAVSITPYQLYTASDEAGKATELVGYGMTNDSSSGIKRRGFNEVDAAYDFVPPSSLAANPLGYILVSDFDSDGSDYMIWFGDSGGPMFIDGYVAGVASWISSPTPVHGDFFGHVRVSKFTGTGGFLNAFVPAASYVPEPHTLAYGMMGMMAFRWIRRRDLQAAA